jgi:hypothetical protein
MKTLTVLRALLVFLTVILWTYVLLVLLAI